MKTSGEKRLLQDRWAAAIVLIAVVAIGVLGLYGLIRLDLIAQATELINRNTPAWLFIVLMLLFPMVGAPLSLFIFVLGIKFGIGYGVLLLALIMPFHILVAYGIARNIRQPIRNYLIKRRNFNIPDISEEKMALFSFLFLAVPLLPYAAKNYALPLTGAPFSHCVLMNWAVQGTLSVPFVVLGKSTADMNLWLFGATLAFLAVLFLLLRRLRRWYETL